MTETRYSPKPISDYGMSAGSNLLSSDISAWNLAYLSWDMENKPMWPDPHFSTHVRRTIQFVIAEGRSDVTGQTPDDESVRGYFLLPAPRAVHLVQRMVHFKNLPMYKNYGEVWRQTIIERSYRYRDNHEYPEVKITSATRDLIRRLK